MICDHSTGRLLYGQGTVEPFTCDTSKAAVEWPKWKRGLDLFLEANQITDPWVKKTHLLLMVGPQVRDIFDNLPQAEEIAGPRPGAFMDQYGAAIKRLDDYFDKKRNVMYERKLFRAMNKKNKLAPNFDPEELIVTSRSGPEVTVKASGGKEYRRSVNHLKRIPETGAEEPTVEESNERPKRNRAIPARYRKQE